MTARHTTSLVLFSLLMMGWSAQGWAQDHKALDHGKIYVKSTPVKGSDIPKVVVTAVVNAPPTKVWEIVSNCDKFKSRMPRVLASKLVRKNGNTYICKVEIDLPFPLSNLTATTRAIHHTGPKRWERKWTLIKGDYSFDDGSWVLTPFGKDGKRTLVVYTVHAEPDTHIPDWVREKAQKSSLPGLIKRIRKEVKKLK